MGVIFHSYFIFDKKIVIEKKGDPDQMPHLVASVLGLHHCVEIKIIQNLIAQLPIFFP